MVNPAPVEIAASNPLRVPVDASIPLKLMPGQGRTVEIPIGNSGRIDQTVRTDPIARPNANPNANPNASTNASPVASPITDPIPGQFAGIPVLAPKSGNSPNDAKADRPARGVAPSAGPPEATGSIRISPAQINTPTMVADGNPKIAPATPGAVQPELTRPTVPQPAEIQQSQRVPGGAMAAETGQLLLRPQKSTGLSQPQPSQPVQSGQPVQPGQPGQMGETPKAMAGFDVRLPEPGAVPERTPLNQMQSLAPVPPNSPAPGRATNQFTADVQPRPSIPGVSLVETTLKASTGFEQVAAELDSEQGKQLFAPRFEGILSPGAIPAHGSAMTRPETARLVAYQLAEGLTAQPGRPVEIALNPEELGRVRMVLNPTDSGVSVAITAERPETLDLMRRNIDLLSAELRRLGYENVGFDFDGGNTDGSKRNDGFPAPDASPDGEMPEPEITRTAQAVAPGGLDLRL